MSTRDRVERKHATKQFLKDSLSIARFYGFDPLSHALAEQKTLLRKARRKPQIRSLKLPKYIRPTQIDPTRFHALKCYIENGFHDAGEQMFVYHGSHDIPFARPSHGHYIAIDAVATSKSIAEAMIIQTALTMLKTLGHTDCYVEINSVGDSDSQSRFTRDCTAYYRKKISELPPIARELLKNDLYGLMCHSDEKCKELACEAPKPIGFLTEQSRAHFTEVLEYLEHLSIPYRINTTLTGPREAYSKTVFEIHEGSIDTADQASRETLLAYGGRYDELARKLGLRKNIPAIGASILLGGMPTSFKVPAPVRRSQRPQVFLIQVGFSAKLLSLHVIEDLRKQNIHIYQSLAKDKLSSQIQLAEKLSIPYTLIIGQKEANERSVIVRNMENRSQDTIPVSQLGPFLKNLIRA
ncbi:MAG: His/Gly/Thr/Pro-type tRNA ligase C-terminal domain-containing protein [Candidatus Paceibacterota bacterium]